MKQRLPMLAVIITFALIAPQTVAEAADVNERPILTQFDRDVSACRRLMRKSCAMMQQLGAASAPAAEQHAEASRLIQQSQQAWQTVRENYAERPPKEYTEDSRFAMRLSEVDEAFAAMREQLTQARYDKAFRTCGAACGLFVSLHEENHLTYSADRLFHLRRALKSAAAVHKSTGSASLRDVLPELLHQRDRVLLAASLSDNDSDRQARFDQAIKELSSAIDELALTAGKADAQATVSSLSAAMMALNTAYDIAL